MKPSFQETVEIKKSLQHLNSLVCPRRPNSQAIVTNEGRFRSVSYTPECIQWQQGSGRYKGQSKCQLLLQSLVLNGNEKTLEIPLWMRLIACDWDSVAGSGSVLSDL